MKLISLIITVFLISGSVFGQEHKNEQSIKKRTTKVVGYIPKRSIDRITENTFCYITDAIYFGIDVDKKGNLGIESVEKDLTKLDTLRAGRPVNLSVCFGGWGRSEFFIEMTAIEKNRNNFCEQVLALCQKYNLNGVDIDWEFPKNKVQKQGFVNLIKDLHKSLNPHGLEITIAVGFWHKQAKLSASVEPYISGVNLMLYDNFNPFKGQTSYTLVKRTCNRFIRMGIPSEKLLIGVPFYGLHRWKYSKTMAYRDVPNPQQNISNKGVYDGYFFDVPATLQKKITYAVNTNKRGIMIWELGQDVALEKDYSLLRNIWEYLTMKNWGEN